jgi:hypothetical protein
MEARDGGAFGSPVANLNVASVAIGSVGYRIVRANCIRLFQDPSESTHRSIQLRERGIVELLGWRGHAKLHLVEYIELQMEAMDDERLQNDLNAY